MIERHRAQGSRRRDECHVAWGTRGSGTIRERIITLIKSMTAYGQGECELGGTVFSAEIKSLNNRYRDIILRLPASLQELEDFIKALISSRIRRGRIDLSIQVNKKDKEMNSGLEINRPLIKSYISLFKQLSEEFGLEERIRPDYLLQIKDILVMKPEEMDVEELRAGVKEVMERALDSMDSMRSREGQVIEEDLLKRLEFMAGYLDAIEEKSPLVVDEYREKLRNKIETISEDIEVDEGRLAQEVAIFASRCDITEEILRARSHLSQFEAYMSMDDSVGRRLDFLVQEINREVNTISAKASNASISADVVEVKSELEKIREQIQNIE
jgi:uncharacterized protein (TIGR00255 family)